MTDITPKDPFNDPEWVARHAVTFVRHDRKSLYARVLERFKRTWGNRAANRETP